jgi:hypothetical protein
MGRRCAWCETVLPSHGGAYSPASTAICLGCFEELEMALARSGLRSARPVDAEAPGPTHPSSHEVHLPRREAYVSR